MKNIYFTLLFLSCFFLQGMAQTTTIVTNSSLVCPNEPVALTAVYTGMTEPVSCLWDFGDGQTSTVCSPTNFYYTGIYNVCVTVTDADNVSVQDCINITAANEITYSSSITNPSCFGGNDGSIVCFPQTGENYIFQWADGSTTEQINNLAAGVYEVTITDVVGCQVVDQFILSDPPQMGINLNSIDPTDCATFDGEISASSIGGGTPPYTYQWSNGQNTATITGLAGGMSYSVTVTDDNGCTIEESMYLNGTIPGSPLGIIITDINGDIDDDGIICAYPQATLSFDNPNITEYIWATGNLAPSITVTTSGTYSVTVVDNNGCTSAEQVDIVFGDPSYEIVITDNSNALLCQGETATLDAGAGNLSYLWNNGATTQTIEVTAGNYSVITEDAGGCYNTDYIYVGYSSPITLQSVTPTDATCGQSNGETTVIASGGMGTLVYSWSNGQSGAFLTTITDLAADTYQVTISDNNGCSIETEVIINESNSIAPDISIAPLDPVCEGEPFTLVCIIVDNGSPIVSSTWTGDGLNNTSGQTVYSDGLPAPGSYTYTLSATNANGCVTTVNTTLVVNGSPFVEITAPDMICEDDIIILEAQGSPATYEWSGIGMSTNSQPTIEASGLFPGVHTYTVTATDANGCTSTAIKDVIVNPVVEIIDITTTDATCGQADGEVTITALGDMGDFTYDWSNGLSGTSFSTLTGLSAGIYQVTITDPNGCSIIESVTVGNIDSPVTTNIIVTHATCGQDNGEAEAVVTNGSGDYTYDWDTGATTTSVTGLSPGTYDMTVIDNITGCQSTTPYVIIDETIDIFDIIITNSPLGVSCAGASDGLVQYYTVPDAIALTEEIVDLNGLVYTNGNLPGGEYCINLYSLDGCLSGTECFEVLQPMPTPVSGTTETLFCPGESLVLQINETFVSYLWSTGATTQFIEVNIPGDYTCIITDVNGCEETIEFLNISEAEDCVWPGDANYDGLANNQDILFLGLSYGNTGNTRNNANINWEGQLAEFEWDSTFSTGINQKHADSDGNGIIEQDDTLAIHQNYNLPPHALRETNLGGDNILAVDFANPTANYEEYVELAITLGDLDETVPEAYGLAFSLTFNYPEVINSASIQVDISNSIFGSETETISLFKPLLADGRMDFAITRFDHVGLENLQGEVLKVRFIIEDNIDGFAPTEDYVLEANLTNIYCVKTWGEEVILTPTSSELTMFGTSSISDLSDIGAVLDYYPNPTKDMLYFNMKGNTTIQKVSIYNALGRLIDEENGNITSIKTSTWVEGMYFLEVTDNTGQAYLIKIVKE